VQLARVFDPTPHLRIEHSASLAGVHAAHYGVRVVDETEAETPSSAGLVRYDALQAYMQEVRRHPLLAPDEEHALAVRYRETGDVEAARRLVTANLRLVVKIAYEYQRAYRNLLDLVQEGNIGLMHAVKRFDPYRGVKLSSYSAWWIRAYILKFILNNWRLVKIGTTEAQRRLFFNLKKEKARLERLGVDAGHKQLAERLSVTEREVSEMEQRLGDPEISLDAPSTPGGETRPLDTIAAVAEAPDAMVEREQFQHQLRERLEAFGATLKGRDKTIFEERLLSTEPLTLEEIGQRYGFTRERARQIEKRLVGKLREYLKKELGEAVEIAAGEK
jgi:RNA polymerase sigma-32 factor